MQSFFVSRHLLAAVTTALSLSGCVNAPPTADMCIERSDLDERIRCMKHVTFGDALEDVGIGAVTGGVVGAGLGGLLKGPKGAIRGGLAGLGVGAAVGGAKAYSDAIADLRDDNRHLFIMARLYAAKTAEYKERIDYLIAALNSETANSARIKNILNNASTEIDSLHMQISDLNKQISTLNIELQKESDYVRNYSNNDDYEQEIKSLKSIIEQLKSNLKERITYESQLRGIVQGYMHSAMGPQLTN